MSQGWNFSHCHLIMLLLKILLENKCLIYDKLKYSKYFSTSLSFLPFSAREVKIINSCLKYKCQQRFILANIYLFFQLCKFSCLKYQPVPQNNIDIYIWNQGLTLLLINLRNKELISVTLLRPHTLRRIMRNWREEMGRRR